MDDLKNSLTTLTGLLSGKQGTGTKRKAQSRDRNPRLYQTLNSFLINLLRESGTPQRVEALNGAVQANIKNLRRSDGSNYKGDLYKILIGVLSNCSAFTETKDGWTIDLEKARGYEESTLKNINRRLGKYRIKSYDEKKTAKLFQQRVRVAKSKDLSEMLETCESLQHDPAFTATLRDPTSQLMTISSLAAAERTLGGERLAGMAAMYRLLQSNSVLQGLQGDTDLTDIKKKVTKLTTDLQDVEKWLNHEDDLLSGSFE